MVRETRHLWVGNLPETVREDRIREHFKRYGRVQSVKILLSSNCNPNLLLSIGSSTVQIKDHSDATDDHPISMYNFKASGVRVEDINLSAHCNSSSISSTCTSINNNQSTSINNNNNNNNNSNSSNNNNSSSSNNNTISNSVSNNVSICSPTNSTNFAIGSVCATVAFMDIKSASKAHTAEHKFDDRVLTTEYYEPSSIPSTSGENSPSSISSLPNAPTQQQLQSQQQSPPHQPNPHAQHASSVTSNLPGSVQPLQQYSSSTTVSPPTVGHRLSTSNHGSSEDLSPSFVDRNVSFYDRSTRLSESSASEMYIRRPNNYHQNESRGRPRDRHFRNGSYASVIDRSNPAILHRSSSNMWYENSNSTNTLRNVYGNLPSAAVAITPDSAYDTTNDRRTSETECSSKSSIKKKKSRSGSESPGGGSTTSRSHSRSPSSCSSTNSGSSNSHGSSSPVSSSDPSRIRNIQSAVSTPATNSSSNSNPAVHSEDNRPLAICVRNLPSRSSDTSLKDGLFHEYKKHGKVTWVKVVGQSFERYALVCFKKPDDVEKALEVSHDKLFFGCKIAVAPYQGFDVEDNEFRPYEAELDEFHPKSTRTLFIGNLEKDISATELRKNFDCFGEIIEIDIKKQGVNAYAFCQYSDIVSVVKAMRQMDGEHLGSNRIKLGFGKSMPTNCVWIDGVSDTVSDNHLSTQFSRFGPVSQVAIDRERKLALVFFEQIQYAQTAVKEMRGVTLRGRKLQVDFASRECQDAFFDKVEKKSCTTPERTNPAFDSNREASRSFDNATTPGARFSRYDTPARSRASSFSRPSNSGAVSPANSGSTTPRGTFVRKNSRYANAEYHESDPERRLKSNDEYSQGSAASHDGEEFSYFRDRPDSPQSRISGPAEIETTAILVRGKSVKSPGVDDESFSSTIKQQRVQSVVVPAEVVQPTALFQPPGDIRHLQKERFHLLEQLEECPSSGDELMSPKKRMKFDIIDSSNLVQTNLVNDSNCDVTFNNLNDTNLLQHRKCVEVRRLSECNTLKHATNNCRRTSTDGGNLRHTNLRSGVIQNDLTDQLMTFQTHTICKRRKTGSSISESEHHSKGRGHQLHSLHSHEASGGESADGSRPGTPLCDERPEIMVPSDPRRSLRERYANHIQPMYLPLPKFGLQMFHQNRLLNSAHSLSSFITTNHSSLSNVLASPPPALLTRPPNNSNLLLNSQHHPNHMSQQQNQQQYAGSSSSQQAQLHSGIEVKSPHPPAQQAVYLPPQPVQLAQPTQFPLPPQLVQPSLPAQSLQLSQGNSMESQPVPQAQAIEQPPESPARAPSLSSNSSDSEIATSPSFEERIKNLDEMFEKWNGGNTNRTHTYSDSSITSGTSNFSNRHKFLELDINEVKPSDILKSVLAKKSIFDDDLKRLENIGEKYEPKEFFNLPRTSSTTICKPVVTSLPSQLPKLQSIPSQMILTPQINQIHPRLNAVSPMNSPQPQSPYNSPSPSPIVVTPNMVGAKMSNSIPTPPSVKGLQYPFPTHPPAAISSTSTSVSIGSNSAPTPQSVNLFPYTLQQQKTTEVPGCVHDELSKPKTHVISKSLSCQEKVDQPGNNLNQLIKSSNNNACNSRILSKSVSAPGSNHSGTIRQPISNFNLNTKDESNDSLDNVVSARSGSIESSCRTPREGKCGHSNARIDSEHRHSKKNELLDRRKWESASSDNSDLISNLDLLQVDGDDGNKEIYNTDKSEMEKKSRLRIQIENDHQARDEQRIKNEMETRKLHLNEIERLEKPKFSHIDEQRRREQDTADAHKWKSEYDKAQHNYRSESDRKSAAYQNFGKRIVQQSDYTTKLNHDRDCIININHYAKSDKHNKENSRKSRESTPLDRQNYSEEAVKSHDRNSRCNSPNKINSKRRLSSQESAESDDGKRFKLNADNLKLFERRDFKDPNGRSGEKPPKFHFNKINNINKNEENSCDMEDRARKDSGFDERRKEREIDKHRRSDKVSHKNRKIKDERIPNQYRDMDFSNRPEVNFLGHNIRFSDDESKKMEAIRDSQRLNLFDQQQQIYRHHGNDSKQNRDSREHREERSKSKKRTERLNSSDRRSCADEAHSSSKSLSESRRQPKQNLNSSDDSDSDEPKKHSIFDIPDDGPAYISMYDKVKARSCKNMQKQEEEKKIKAKFSQLKQCRAKREGKKHSNSYDEDSDSDTENNERRLKHSSNKNKHFIDSSSDDSDDPHSFNKDMIYDSGSGSRKGLFRSNRLNELCDGESSENSSLHQFHLKPRRKISSRKNSRSARITSETSDDASESVSVKQESLESDGRQIKVESNVVNVEGMSETQTKNVDIPKEDSKREDVVKFQIKTEPVDETYEFESQTPERASNLCDLSDADSITPSSKASESKDSIFENLFSLESKKKHKKNKRRQKSPSNLFEDEPKQVKHEDVKLEKAVSMETVFDELKRESSFTSEKKRHSKKEKKRDKLSKEEHDRTKEEKYRMKKLKKQSRVSSDASMFESQESFSSNKRGEKMEDIFGPISDDDSHISSVETSKAKPLNFSKITATAIAHPTKPLSSALLIQPQVDNLSELKSISHNDKEKHREKRKEKRRKEREKLQQSLSSKDDDNSVDLDAAARVLEAQLVEDSEQKTEEYSENMKSFDQMTDVFRFSENEEGQDHVFHERKTESSDTHRTKEKKKKKKKSKEEKRHHHHHSSHSNVISPPSTPQQFIDTSETLERNPVVKQSTGLPCLTADSPPSIEKASKENAATNTHSLPMKHSDDKRKDSKALIPGYSMEIDAKIHDTAVQSISSDYAIPIDAKTDIIVEKIIENPDANKSEEKIDEKSRVIISQEETEDAVAALLGESFGTSTGDYTECYTADPIVEEEENNLQTTIEAIIPEDEAEEMRKAVQSLNTEELDIKPDTPQSDNELQIDTDTEEPDEENAIQTSANTSQVETKSVSTCPEKGLTKPSDLKPVVLKHLSPIAPVSTMNVSKPLSKPNETIRNILMDTRTRINANLSRSVAKLDDDLNDKSKVFSSVADQLQTIRTPQHTLLQPPLPTQQQPTPEPQPPPPPPPPPPLPMPLSIQKQSQIEIMSSVSISSSASTAVITKPLYTLAKPAALSHLHIPGDKSRSLAGSFTTHPQTLVVTQSLMSPQISTPVSSSTVQNPIIARKAMPPRRQSIHISPAKPSLSHVVIQQRQLMSPPIQKTTIANSIPINLPLNRIPITSVPASVSTKQNQMPTSSRLRSCQSGDTDLKEVPSSDSVAMDSSIQDREAKVTSAITTSSNVVTSTPTTVVSTQLPQMPKQIVFETKLQNKSVAEQKVNVTPHCVLSDSRSMPLIQTEEFEITFPKTITPSSSIQKPTQQTFSEKIQAIPNQKESSPATDSSLAKKLDHVSETILSIAHPPTSLNETNNHQSLLPSNVKEPTATIIEDVGNDKDVGAPSVISSTKTIHTAENPIKLDEMKSAAMKEENDFWSAKDVNIESVIKKVDALCSADDEAILIKQPNLDRNILKSDNDVELLQKPDDNISVKDDSKDELDVKSEFIKCDNKNQTKRDKPLRNKKSQQLETPSAPSDVSKTMTNILMATDTNSGGVQTRKGVGKATATGKRGRGGRNVSPRSTAQSNTGIIPGSDIKIRNTNSESDVYEFHEDSGEEIMAVQSCDGARSRPLLVAKQHTGNQPPNPITLQLIPANQSSIGPVQTGPIVQEMECKPVASEVKLAEVSVNKTLEQQEMQEPKDDVSMPASSNLRKSRRLIERDGSRSTVDDIIEDVVKNMSLSNKMPSPVIITSETVNQTPSTTTQPRRSTRSTNQVTTKLTQHEKVDIKKSPRPNRNTIMKERKVSDHEILTDDKTDVTQRNEYTLQEEKKTGIILENRNKTEIGAITTNPTVAAKIIQMDESFTASSTPILLNKETDVEDSKAFVITTNQAQTVDSSVISSVEKRSLTTLSPSEPMTLIDPVTGELTVVQQSNEGQYVPVTGSAKLATEPAIKSNIVKIIPKTEDRLRVEVVTSLPSNVSTTPVVTIINKSMPNQSNAGCSTGVLQMQKPSISITSCVSSPLPQNKIVISSHVKPNEHHSRGLTPPQHMDQQKPKQQIQPQIQIQPLGQTQQLHSSIQTQPARSHPLKAHVLNAQINKVNPSQTVISSSNSPVIFSTSTPNAMSNVQPVIKSSTIVHSSVAQPIITPMKYNKEAPTTVITQQPQHQPQMMKSQVPIHTQAQVTQMQPPNKSTLIVNIPTSSPMGMSSTHSPRISPNISTKLHTQQPPPEAQFSIHTQKLLTNVQHQNKQQMLSQTPVVIHSNKLHLPVTSTNYTSVVQSSGKVIQTPLSHHIKTIQTINSDNRQPSSHSLVQMGAAQQVQLQHMPPAQNKSNPSLQINIAPQGQRQSATPPQQQQQPPTMSFVHNLPIQTFGGGKPTQRNHQTIQQISSSQHIMSCGSPTISAMPSQQIYQPPSKQSFQSQTVPPPNQSGKAVMGLHQSPQIMTGAVASPPPKQPHLSSQQPIVTGASSSRVSVPSSSPQGQQNRPHNLQQPGLPVPAYDAKLHSDVSGFGIIRTQSPPPAHQQASPITPGDGSFPSVPLRGVQRDHFMLYQQYMRAQEALGHGARIPYIPRSTLLPGSSEQKELCEIDDQLGTSPPLELRRSASGSRPTIAVPHSLQSPQDRATDSPQVAQVYVHGTRIPHPHFPEVGARFYENARPSIPSTSEPPPAHRNPLNAASTTSYAPISITTAPNELPSHLHNKVIEREREQREKERNSSIPGHTNSPCPSGLVPAMAAPSDRNLQVGTPPHASQVPPQADSLLMLLQRYPVMWQGLLALKTDQAAVQMHFVFGNPDVASGSLPCNSDGSTPPLRIAQRMRLEQTQLDGVARKMQTDNEHCMLLALPCGRDHLDVLQQSTNLQTGFITYLQQKQAAGIVNIPAPGSEQAAYVVHIFPSCDFANENLARIAPDLLHRVADIAHLLIVIATV